MFIFAFTLGLALAAVFLILTCALKHRQSVNKARVTGYDTADFPGPTEASDYEQVILYDVPTEPDIQVTTHDSETRPQRDHHKTSRHDAKERVSVETLGRDTKITLDDCDGRWKFLRSQIVQNSKKKSRSHKESTSPKNVSKTQAKKHQYTNTDGTIEFTIKL